MRVATRSVVLLSPRKSSRSLRDASTILGLARLRDEASHKRKYLWVPYRLRIEILSWFAIGGRAEVKKFGLRAT